MRRILVPAVLVTTVVACYGAGTTAALAADECPNADLRAKQAATFLPECRAYEQVTPVDKNGFDVLAGNTISVTHVASTSGDAIAYGSTGAFSDSDGAGLVNYFSGHRGAPGAPWQTTPLTPALYGVTGNRGTSSVFAVSNDGTKAVVGSLLALAPGAVTGQGNLYLRDTRTGAYTLAATSPDPSFTNAMNTNSTVAFLGTDDFDHVVFDSVAALTPDAVSDDYTPNVYDWSGGRMHLVSRRPDGSTMLGGYLGNQNQQGRRQRPISADGSRIFFTSGGALYVRIDDATTELVSRSQTDPDTPLDGGFLTASSDGTRILFSSTATPGLVDGAQSGDFYIRDLGNGSLVTLTPRAPSDTTPLYAIAVWSTGDDLRSVYFVANGAFAPGAAGSGSNLYHWQDGVLRTVATLDLAADGPTGGQPPTQNPVVSPNGRYLVFQSRTPLAGTETANLACENGYCRAVYLYDSATDELRCVSCTADGDASHGDSNVGGQTGYITIGPYLPRGVLDDGSVFFDTREALSRSDVNGRFDVYRYRAGVVDRLSPGLNDSEARFADASASGDALFFVTGDRLVQQDDDNNNDMYVAQIDGGLADQNATPAAAPTCDGDTCQGTPATAPAPAVAASITLTGPGDGASPDAPRASGPPKVSKVKTVRGTSTSLAVTVPGRGRVEVSGSGLQRSSRTATKAGTYRVAVRLSARAKRTLAQRHRVTVRATVRFTPSGGKAQSVRVTVWFTGTGR